MVKVCTGRHIPEPAQISEDSIMQSIRSLYLTIPPDVNFSDLNLQRDSVTGDLTFEWAPIERICEASGIKPEDLMEKSEETFPELLIAWYQVHLDNGGAPDRVEEQILAEVEAEIIYGVENVLHSGSVH
jgi:hypothetical protein